MQRPLASYLVVDLTTELGWLCGKILGEFGCDVLKVEPPGGDPGRRSQPYAFAAWNLGKRSAVLDLRWAEDRKELIELAKKADFLIESFPPGYMHSIGLGWEQLHACNPRLVMTSITPYGQKGPAAGAPASDLEISASSGAVWLAGDPDRAPVRITLPQSAGWASIQAAMGTLLAHYARQRTGRGQHVDVSAQASLVPALVNGPYYWEILRQMPMRGGPYLTGRNVEGVPMRNVWPCKDGFVAFAIYGGVAGRQSNRALVQWMAKENMAPVWLADLDWESFDVATVKADEIHRLEEAIAPFLKTLTKWQFLNGAMDRRILGYVVSTVEDILGDPQLQSREVWREYEGVIHPTGYARFDGQQAYPVIGVPVVDEIEATPT